ncbi:disintegrin and metalloproteinase domain-containing protein 10-like [Ornithodoros turicata]|uniref:disintegrin and metalloproteinase domain-containing protein 10-like n=1 Tax=Ornithodoros turicata TaxID=34597 RepID=UPI00313885C5
MVPLLLIIMLCVKDGMTERLNRFIRHYESLRFPLEPSITPTASRQKRSTPPRDTVLHFTAFGRDFHLVLWRDTSTFAKHFIALTPSGKVDLDISHVHSGKLLGYPESRVFGYVKQGTFQGHIQMGDGSEYYVDPGWKYFGRNADFFVVYSADDVEMPADLSAVSWCGVCQLYARNATATNTTRIHVRDKRRTKGMLDYIEVNAEPIEDGHRTKKPRSVTRKSLSGRLCNLHVTIDHTLYRFFLSSSFDESSAKDRIVATVASHVYSASQIFSTTDFDGVVGVSFAVHTLQINTGQSCKGKTIARNSFCSDTLDANVMLEVLSRDDHDRFCLAFIFTYRDFNEGILGLAYVGNANRNAGGICDKYRSLQFNSGVRRMGLNTGVVTLLNYGSFVPERLSQITFAHEIGHTFGARHDSGTECAPGEPNGNYIMFPRATSGTKENNRKFSSCSIEQIGAVVQVVLHAKYGKDNCFLESEGAYCGNNIREGEEECDCGYSDDDCTDSCCYPYKNNEGKAGCKLRPHAACSPTAGSCCSSACSFMDQNHRCSEENECKFSSTSTSVSAECPQQRYKDNLTVCNKGTQVCQNGLCEGSICQKYGFEDCQVTGRGHTEEQMCRIFCRASSEATACVDPCEVPQLKPLCDVRKQPGAACDNNNGYCDAFRRCRSVNEEGPLTKLEGIFFRKEGIRQWIENHVILSLLISVMAILGLALFIRCCAVMTPTNNPVMRPARTFKEGIASPAEVILFG